MDRKGAKYSNSLKNELFVRVLEYYSVCPPITFQNAFDN